MTENRVARHLTAAACLYAGAAILTRWPWTVSHICHTTWHRGLGGKLAVLGLLAIGLHHFTRGMRHCCPICAVVK